MKKTLKILGLTLAVLFGLLVAAAIILPLVFDPNQYKGEIIRLVKDQTGRDLKIEKKIGWSFFPRLGVEAGGLELSNAPGFGKEPFAKIDAAGVHVEFLPLLSGKITVDTVFLHGLNLNLAKNAAGRNNWKICWRGGQARTTGTREEGARQAADRKRLASAASTSSAPTSSGATIPPAACSPCATWSFPPAGSSPANRWICASASNWRATRRLPIKAALQSRLTASPDALTLVETRPQGGRQPPHRFDGNP